VVFDELVGGEHVGADLLPPRDHGLGASRAPFHRLST
jgi:hypothetical protein